MYSQKVLHGILFQNTEQGERPFEWLRKGDPKRIVNCSLDFKD